MTDWVTAFSFRIACKVTLFLSEILIFPRISPHSLLWPALCVRHGRSLVADAHVRPLVVVEGDDSRQFLPACLSCGYRHPVEPFGLEYAVRALCHGVLQRVSALRHADPSTTLPEDGHVCLATVLAAPVGVVDQVPGRVVVNALVSHAERLYRIGRLQRWAYRPAYDFVRVQVCDERQVAYALACLHIGDVADPYLIGAVRDDVLDEVRVLAVAVLGIGCLVMTAAFHTHHETMPAQHVREGVTAGEAACLLEQLLHDGMQLGGAQAGVGLPVLARLLHDDGLYRVLSKTIPVHTLVVGLSAVTKQPAKSAQA